MGEVVLSGRISIPYQSRSMATHDDFHGDEHARGVLPLAPVEDALVGYCNARMVLQFPLLQLY